MPKANLWDKLLSLFFPAKCIFCGRVLPAGKPGVCERCLPKLPLNTEGLQRYGDYFSSCAYAFRYEGSFRSMFHRYKFSGKSCYAGVLGEFLAEAVYRDYGTDFDILTWAPLDKKRLRSRGYDQARLLAEEAGRHLQVRPVPLLIKKKGVSAQSKTGSPERRRANISGAYSVLDEKSVLDKKILLIDDVITSGSTLSECSRVLLRAGAEKVICATLAGVD